MEKETNKENTQSTKQKNWHLCVLIALIGAFMTILDSSIVNVAIPTMMHVFNTDLSSIQWVVTIYLLSLGVVVPVSGWLGDKLGFKKLYIYSLLVFTLGSLFCALSWNVPSLIISRVIQALGGGMIMPITMAMIVRIVPINKMGTAMGIFGIALLVAPAIGPTLGGFLVEYVDWRWIFTINLPIGIIGSILSILYLPDFPKVKTGKLDIGGLITSAIMLFSILLALSEGSDWGWTSEPIILLFYTSFIMAILFVFIELTSKNPLLDLRVFKYRVFTAANIVSIVTTIGLYAGIFYIPFFLQNLRGLGAMEAGFLMMPGALVSGLMAPITGKIYDKTGPKYLALVGLIILSYTTYLLHNLDINTSNTTIIVWMMLRGVGMSFASMPVQTASVASVPQDVVSRASAITNIIQRVSASLGIAVLTGLLTSRAAIHSATLKNTISFSNKGLAQLMAKFSNLLGSTSAIKSSVGLSYIQGIITQISYVKAIDEVFILASAITVIGIIPILFLKKTSSSGKETENLSSYE